MRNIKVAGAGSMVVELNIQGDETPITMRRLAPFQFMTIRIAR